LDLATQVQKERESERESRVCVGERIKEG